MKEKVKGYKEKPKSIVIISCSYLISPFINIFLSYLINDEYMRTDFAGYILSIFRTVNLRMILFVLFWISAFPLVIGLYQVRLWAFIYFILHALGSLVISLFITGSFGINFLFFINVIFTANLGFLIFTELKKPYLNPSMRWWNQPKRVQKTLKVVMNGKPCSTYDISDGGVFITAGSHTALPKVSPEEIVHLQIYLDDLVIPCDGSVRWINNNPGHYPAGYGIQFENLSLTYKSLIKKFVQNLIKSDARLSR